VTIGIDWQSVSIVTTTITTNLHEVIAMRDNTQIASKTQTINIINDDGTPRVDSRIIAERLGIQHHNLIENIRKYKSEFNHLGILPFETEEIKGRGQPEKYALLNEDQTIFVLTLSRNTPEVVQLKLDLTVAFRNARQVATQPTSNMLSHARVNKELMSLFGIESNMQTLALNNAMQKEFGVNLLDTWGMDAGLKAERQEQLYTITELAKKLGVSRTAINPILIELGLQTGERDHKEQIKYKLTDKGYEYGVYLDVGKQRSDGTPIRQIKWYDSAIEMIKSHLESEFVGLTA